MKREPHTVTHMTDKKEILCILRLEYDLQRQNPPLPAEREIRSLPGLTYDADTCHWTALIWSKEVCLGYGAEIYIYGNAEGPQSERLPIAKTMLQFLEEIELRAQIDIGNYFEAGGSPFSELSFSDIRDAQFRQILRSRIDPFDAWSLIGIYCGVVGNEPVDEFRVDFWWGIWGAGPYYAWYRLNSEHPEQSVLIRCGQEN
jgi:hypothetical protein